jgi:GMP synthase-like glutamine amidotransferase
MKTLCVVQHVEAEYLGLIEDHLEGRGIRFHYVRPFVAGGVVPRAAGDYRGLILLGAGPFGIVSGDLVPSLAAEFRLAEDFLKRGLPIVGLGLGSAILAVAAGGGAAEAPLRFVVGEARRTVADALAGHLPEAHPISIYMRDRPVLPQAAQVLAIDDAGAPAIFQIGDNCLGFLGHPGVKSAMIEDLVMAFEETPADVAEGLRRLRAAQRAIAAALSDVMVGVIKTTHLMDPADLRARRGAAQYIAKNEYNAGDVLCSRLECARSRDAA